MASIRLRSAVVAVTAAGTLVTGTALAAAAVSTHLGLAGFCTNDVAVTGVGSTLQTNAVNQAFDPALQASCGKAFVSWAGGGSGAGISSQLNRTALIGGSDDPLSAENQALAVAAGKSPIHDIPVLVSPVSIVYNLPCAGSAPLKLSSIQIAKMYDGVVKTWDSPVLTLGNSGLKQCTGVPINLVARADVSGTTFIVKSYLAHRNPEYVALEQDQLNQTWLGSIACRGNGTGGVLACVAGTANSIGYAATSNANQSGLKQAQVDNPAHLFSSPSPSACTLAATLAPVPPSTMANWSAATFTDSVVGYPICSFTYDMTFNNAKTGYGGLFSQGQVQDAVDYLTTAVGSAGQGRLAGAGYAQLPITVDTIAKTGVMTISYK